MRRALKCLGVLGLLLVAMAGPVYAQTIVADIVASRSTGCVAPCAVHFNARGTTHSTMADADEFHELLYEWDFDDSGAGNWSTTGLTKETATGPIAAHVYETPGTYDPTLNVTDQVGTTNGDTVQIVVTDPAVVFDDALTICVSMDSLPVEGVGGCPDDATCVQQAAWSTVVGTYALQGQRVLLKRGDTWGSSTEADLQQDGPGIIGAYGTGADPIIQGFSADNNGIDIHDSKDWRIMNIDIVSTSEDEAGIYATPAAVSDGIPDQVLFFEVDVVGFDNGLEMTDWGLAYTSNLDAGSTYTGIFLVDSTFTGNGQGWGVHFSPRQSAMMGCTVSGNYSHTVRSAYALETLFQHNDFSGVTTNDTGQLFKMHGVSYDWPVTSELYCTGYRLPLALAGDNGYPTKHNLISDNYFNGASESVGNYVMTLGPQSSGDDLDSCEQHRYEHVEDIIVERNYFDPPAGPTDGNKMIVLNGPRMTVRNNIFHFVDGQSTLLFVEINQIKPGNIPDPDDCRIYNNSMYAVEAGVDASWDGTQGVIWINDTGTAPDGTEVRNNILYAPNTTIGDLPIIGDEGTNTVSSNNLSSYSTSPFSVADPDIASEFAILTDSAAKDAGYKGSPVDVPVYIDYIGTTRPSGSDWDIGAYEFDAGEDVCGDSVVEGAEECDDGGVATGDGCDDVCQIEHGWECSGEPSVCIEVCGNDLISASEGCDDSNTDNADGCNSSCAVEPGWLCPGEPSVCKLIGSSTRAAGSSRAKGLNSVLGGPSGF